MNNFYVYAYLRDDQTPYYIGKGKNNRVFEKHHVPVPRDRERIKFLYKDLFENQALAFEIFWIAVYGRKDIGTGILRNLSNGGDGTSGYEHKESARNKISTYLKGNQHAKGKNLGNQNGFKKGHPTWNIGKCMPDKSKQKISETKTKYTYHTPKGIFQTKREMLLAFPEYTCGQIERFTFRTLEGFSRRFKDS